MKYEDLEKVAWTVYRGGLAGSEFKDVANLEVVALWWTVYKGSSGKRCFMCYVKRRKFLLDEYVLPQYVVSVIEKLCGESMNFGHFRAWEITGRGQEIEEVLRVFDAEIIGVLLWEKKAKMLQRTLMKNFI